MCLPTQEGKKLTMDCANCPFEMYSGSCIGSHFKAIAAFNPTWETLKYEEELTIEFSAEKVEALKEFVTLIRELEKITSDTKTYGYVQDEHYNGRIKLIKEVYDALFVDPRRCIGLLEEYSEKTPSKALFLESSNKFQALVKALLKAIGQTKLVAMIQGKDTLRELILDFARLKPYEFVEMLLLPFPENAKDLDDPETVVNLKFGVTGKLYDLEGSEANLYVIENPLLDNIDAKLIPVIRQVIADGMKDMPQVADMVSVYDDKIREYRNHFVEKARDMGIELKSDEALALGRECASWTVGLGAPLENICLDKENITDIYIDGQNSPIYIEHRKFGLCHTIYRYNSKLLEHAFRNIVVFSMQNRRFDDKNPVVDIVLRRLNMRCHMQRPPATFGELQGALRIMRSLPFTYSQYLNYYAMTPFYAGYDDLMVSLGCSEAVLGLKGVGKTAFTSAKVSAIGTKMRILPIQDIEEIPVKAYRKRGFHIGAMRVQSSDIEGASEHGNELDLMSMANASLRMGDACIIINEIRSKTTIQGVINILNTQPGVFILYNLHAQSLKDVQDRLELVFGIPAASMFATDRYSFLKKIRFGRKKTTYRLLGEAYESNPAKHTFDPTFIFQRGKDIHDSKLECMFLKNSEAHSWKLDKLDFKALEKNLDIVFEPPALTRRCDEKGIPVEEYLMQAFFKAKIYYDITEIANKLNQKKLLEIDFVLRANSEANKLLAKNESENGTVDYPAIIPEWTDVFKKIAKEELKLLQST